MVLRAELSGAGVLVFFDVGAPLSFNWARDTVVGAIIDTSPATTKAPQTVGIFMLPSIGKRVTTTRLQIEIAPTASA